MKPMKVISIVTGFYSSIIFLITGIVLLLAKAEDLAIKNIGIVAFVAAGLALISLFTNLFRDSE
jgi:hypothetical protein